MCAKVQTISSATPSGHPRMEQRRDQSQWRISQPPSCCMPCVRAEFPATLLRTVMRANSAASLPAVRRRCGFGQGAELPSRRHWPTRLLLLPLLRDEFLPARPQGHIFARFFGQALAVVRIEDHFTNHTPDHSRPEIVFAVKALHPIHQFRFVQILVNHLGKLISRARPRYCRSRSDCSCARNRRTRCRGKDERSKPEWFRCRASWRNRSFCGCSRAFRPADRR